MEGLEYTVQTSEIDNSMASLGVGVHNWRDRRGGGKGGAMVPHEPHMCGLQN